MIERTPQGTTKAKASRKSMRKRLKKIHVQPTMNGGYVVTHHHQPEYGGTPASEKHAFTDYASMHAHVAQTMKGHH